MKPIQLCLLLLFFITACKWEVEQKTRDFEVLVTEKGSNIPIAAANVSLVRCPIYGDCDAVVTQKTNADGRAVLTTTMADEPGVMASHPQYWTYIRPNAYGPVKEVQMWPFAYLKVRLRKVNAYAADNRIILYQKVDMFYLSRPSTYDVPPLPIVADTVLYMKAMGNDSNYINLSVQDKAMFDVYKVTTNRVFVAKGDTAEINLDY
jgi:hypothetical protein